MPLAKYIQWSFGAIALLALALSPTQKGFALAGVNVTISDLLLAAAFGLALLTPGFFRRRPPAENVAFAALVAVSAFFGGNLRDGLKEWMQIALYFLVGERVMATAQETWGEKWERRACGVLLAIGGATAVLALVQYFSPDPDVFPLCLRPGLAVRGAFGNNNVLCGFYALLLPFAFSLSLERGRPWWLRATLGLLVVAGLMTMFSGAALAIVAAVMSATAFRHYRILGAVTALVLLGAFFLVAPELPRDNFTTAVQSAELYHSDSGSVRYSEEENGVLTWEAGEPTRRYPEWQAALTMSFEHPLVGMGPGSYQRNIGPFYDVVPRATGPNEPDTQNLYLVIASTMGYPALFAFLAILYAAWNAGRDKEAGAFQRAAAAGIAAFAFAAIWHPLLVRGLGIPLVFLLAIARRHCQSNQ
jgi:hypothetical protein